MSGRDTGGVAPRRPPSWRASDPLVSLSDGAPTTATGWAAKKGGGSSASARKARRQGPQDISVLLLLVAVVVVWVTLARFLFQQRRVQVAVELGTSELQGEGGGWAEEGDDDAEKRTFYRVEPSKRLRRRAEDKTANGSEEAGAKHARVFVRVSSKSKVEQAGASSETDARRQHVGRIGDKEEGEEGDEEQGASMEGSKQAREYPGAGRLGRERPLPRNPRVYPINNHHIPLDAFVYGVIKRVCKASNLPTVVQLLPPASMPLGAANLSEREGCPAAAQPLKLVPEFSTYIFKHLAAAPSGQSLRYVHMGSVAAMPRVGRLLAAFQASKWTEGAGDQRIYLSTSADGGVGQQWTAPVRLPVKTRGIQWSPVLHLHPRTGDMWMFYTESPNRRCYRPKTSKFPPRWTPGGDVMVTSSSDGRTWHAPRRVYSMAAEGGTPKVIANNLLVAKSGTWMLPFWRESYYFNEETGCSTDTPDSHGILISRDEGQTWSARGAITMLNTHLYEGTVAELGDGSIMMVFRTQLAAAAVSKSWDDGDTWSEPMLLTVDNPDSKPNVLNIWPHGDILMAYNDHTKLNVACRSCRTKLSVSRLVNATGAWDHIAQFGPSPSDFLKVHYPSMVQHGCRLLVVYSSMYTCCAPHEECDCAPTAAETGLQMDSYKIWEDTSAAEQLDAYSLTAESPSSLAQGLWSNFWWSDLEQPDKVFSSIHAAKQATILGEGLEGAASAMRSS